MSCFLITSQGRSPVNKMSFFSKNRFWGQIRNLREKWCRTVQESANFDATSQSYGRGTNYWTIWLNITPKLHVENAPLPTPKIGRGARRRGQFCAPPVSRFLRAILASFRRNVQPSRAISCPSAVPLAGCIEIGWFLARSAPVFTQIPNLASKSTFPKINKIDLRRKTSVQPC